MKKTILLLIIFMLPIISCSDNKNKNEKYLELGYENIVSGDYASALENFNIAIEIDPQSVEGYINRGLVLGIMGDYSSALADFNKSIELDSDNAEAYKSRGITKLYLEQKSAGCQDLSQAARMGYPNGYNLVNEFCR